MEQRNALYFTAAVVKVDAYPCGRDQVKEAAKYAK
jgi:hypothetical protein